jgi:glycosyltransferase involved in cell wall biosynthesis
VLEERDLWPDWAELTPVLQIDRTEFARKNEEIELANVIVAPSRFVERTLRQRFPSLPTVEVVPFGAPHADPLTAAELDRSAAGALRALYVGALDLRKGIPYLFEALRRAGGAVTQTVVGRARAPCAALTSALGRGRWLPSVPRSEVLHLMRDSDVFVFPTLFEGMALVVLEAMSQGCVVITTANSGAEDLIRDGETGFLVPVRSADAIVEVLERLDQDRGLLRRVRQNAQARAMTQSWERYRGELRRIASAAHAA